MKARIALPIALLACLSSAACARGAGDGPRGTDIPPLTAEQHARFMEVLDHVRAVENGIAACAAAAYNERVRPRFLTSEDVEALLTHGVQRRLFEAIGDDVDFPPVVKLVGAQGRHVWLLSELNPERPWIAYGLADLGFGHVEYGYVDLEELANVEAANVQRDPDFSGTEPLSAYAARAREFKRIAD